jgi:hypothetical protein
MKLLLALSILVCTSVMPVHALTQPKDSIGIVHVDNRPGGEFKNYFKPWQQLTLDKKTRDALLNKNKMLDNNGNEEKYRIAFLFFWDGELTRASFMGERGSVVMMDWPKGTECSLNFDGNGGFAGVNGQACH